MWCREQTVQRLLECRFELGEPHVQTTLRIPGADVEASARAAAAFEHDRAVLANRIAGIGQRNCRAAVGHIAEHAGETLGLRAECN